MFNVDSINNRINKRIVRALRNAGAVLRYRAGAVSWFWENEYLGPKSAPEVALASLRAWGGVTRTAATEVWRGSNF